jgi:3-ketosteroid 9alpha-monooxygenase subunit A
MTAAPAVGDPTKFLMSAWTGHRDWAIGEPAPELAEKTARYVIEQVEADIVIWSHQRYADPAALARGKYSGFTALRSWAQQFYPVSEGLQQ